MAVVSLEEMKNYLRVDFDDAMVMYKNFRGHEPEVGPLLENRGLK